MTIYLTDEAGIDQGSYTVNLPRGLEGAVGPQGQTGATGSGIKRIIDNRDNTMTIVTDTNSYTVNLIRGVKVIPVFKVQLVQKVHKVQRAILVQKVNRVQRAILAIPALQGPSRSKGY